MLFRSVSQSRYKGIFGKSGDMRDVLASWTAGDEQAVLALDMYIERLKSAIGAMTATLGGVDCLVFTAGIGENSAVVRQLTCNGLGFLGISVDHNLNEGVSSDIDIATPDSRVRIFVIHTQEDWEIAAECWRLTLHHANSHN